MCGIMLDAGSHLTLLEFEIVQKSRKIVQKEIDFSTPPSRHSIVQKWSSADF
jgi:hypothetical protein